MTLGNANGSVTLPSGTTYSVTNGIASINGEDVDQAIQQGWQVMAGQPWPAVRLVRMAIPAVGAWPASGTVTLPDGSTVTTAAGVGKMPQAWVTWARGLGWVAV